MDKIQLDVICGYTNVTFPEELGYWFDFLNLKINETRWNDWLTVYQEYQTKNQKPGKTSPHISALKSHFLPFFTVFGLFCLVFYLYTGILSLKGPFSPLDKCV